MSIFLLKVTDRFLFSFCGFCIEMDGFAVVVAFKGSFSKGWLELSSHEIDVVADIGGMVGLWL